jgi:spoIIIJ-associated protein
MTEEREFEGKDLEEALTDAAQALGIPQHELHYEMLETGRRGLLGLGVKNVRIRVKPPIEAELPEGEPPRAKKKPAKAKKPSPAKKPAMKVDAGLKQEVEQAVLQLVEATGLELQVATEARDDGIGLQLHGPDEKLLLSRNAELLSAIQFLLNRMSRRAWPGVGRITVSCNGHATPRDAELISAARRAAKQVARTGKTRRLKPMNAYERRIVHLAVREFPGLTSSSDGSGSLKRVRISKVQNKI